jgi:hypothetical protein
MKLERRKQRTLARALAFGFPGSHRPLRPAPEKKPSTRRHEPVFPGGALTVRFRPSVVYSALGPPCCARTINRLSNSGFPWSWHPLTRDSYFHRIDHLTRHPKQIPLWVAITVSAPKHLESKADRGFRREAGEFLRVVNQSGHAIEWISPVSYPPCRQAKGAFRDRGGSQC